MSRAILKSRTVIRLLTGILGFSLFAYLIHRADPARLLASMVAIGWGLFLVLAWGGVPHVVKTWAWRVILRDDKHRVSVARMLGLRLASEALGQLGGLGQVFGEGLRVSLLGEAMPRVSGIASVTLDRVFFILSGAMVSIVGLLAVLIVLPLPHKLALYARLFVCVLVGVILLSVVAVKKRWPIISYPAQILGRFRYFRGWIERESALIQSVENSLFDFYHNTPGPFWASFALNFACHAAAVLEVCLILWLMGAKVSLLGGLAIESLTKLVNAAGTFNPGNLGLYEAGNMLIVKVIGLAGSAGLTLAFTRRLRALFWAAVGIICLTVLHKARRQRNSIESSKDVMQNKSEQVSSRAFPTASARNGTSHTAIIFANNLDGFSRGSSMPEVGALPILLRSILGAHKAGAARIVVLVHRVTGFRIKHGLIRTGRLPQNVEWCELSSGGPALSSRLGQLASEAEGHLVVMAGDRVYHPSLHRLAGEWNGEEDALAFTTGRQFVGICALSREVSLAVARRFPPSASSIEELYYWLTASCSVGCEHVRKDNWQRIHTEQQRRLAERKLDRWLVKSTDGIFARTNRKISIPISRQLIRFPITPNMVSLFTLGVSFAAGLFFALGGYWNMLTGAVLSWLASVLDGCDGEVARLKLQESDFGCWLETVCDYLYYVFIFVGMTIGLARMSSNRAYLVWGCFLVFGAIATIVSASLQRHRMSSQRPEQFLQVWQKEAENRRSNPFLYFGRHTEFIIRRCFLPYVILFFALFHIMNWLLIAGAVGANVVWIISLYSYLTFAPAQAETAASPA